MENQVSLDRFQTRCKIGNVGLGSERTYGFKWSLRNGPSVADIPGPGVVVIFRCVRKVYLRTITPESSK